MRGTEFEDGNFRQRKKEGKEETAEAKYEEIAPSRKGITQKRKPLRRRPIRGKMEMTRKHEKRRNKKGGGGSQKQEQGE